MSQISKKSFEFKQLDGTDGYSQNIRLDNFINSEKNLVETFCREYFQNLYDARKTGCTAKTRIRILSENDFDLKYLEEITKKVEEPLNPKKLSSMNKKILVLEEEGTTGLRGDLEIHSKGSDHVGFWHNVGQSEDGKLSSGNKSGSAGQGNIIYFGSSQVNSVFVYTKRENATSHEEYVMGKCELPNTWSDKNDEKVRYDFQGFWADISPQKDVKPFDDSAEIKKFKKAFKLERNFSETGLSLVIPYIDEEFTEEEILKATIKEYFYSILLGNIEVEVCGESLTKHKIMEIADRVSPESKEYRDFLLETQTIDDQDILDIKDSWVNTKMNDTEIDENYFVNPLLLDKAKDDFNKGKVISFKFPVKIKEKAVRKPKEAHFNLYLSSNCVKEERNIIRNGIPISNEPKRISPLGANFRSLLLIGTDELGTYCKRAENPNHTEFDPKRKSFADKYHRDSLFPSLRRISNLMAKYFIGIQNDLNQDLLNSILSVSVLDPGDNFKKPNKNQKKKKKNKHVPLVRHEYFDITEGNGWCMKKLNHDLPTYPSRIECVFGIAEEGSAHNLKPKSYDPSDFNLGDTSQNWLINTHHCVVISKDFNKVILQIDKPDFFVEIQNQVFFDRFDLISSATLI